MKLNLDYLPHGEDAFDADRATSRRAAAPHPRGYHEKGPAPCLVRTLCDRRPVALHEPPSLITPRQSAFTLIELLVVIAIVAILAALLLQALSRSKALAQSAACQANLKSLQYAWLTYAHNNNDTLPPNNAKQAPWIMLGLSNAWGNSWVWGNARVDTNTANIEHGVLFPDVASAAVYHCPADQSTVTGIPGRRNKIPPGLRRTRSYSMNSWLNAHIESSTYERRVNDTDRNLQKLSQMINPPPTKIFVFIDEHEQSIGDGIFGIPFRADVTEGDFTKQPWWGASMPSDRHLQGCNLSFADGHTEHHRWKSPKKGMPEGDFQIPASPDDLEDLRWLQERIPEP